MKKIIPRKSGTSQGQWDAYLFTPDGTKIRNVHDITRGKLPTAKVMMLGLLLSLPLFAVAVVEYKMKF